jgi:dephospho-CoA kinase
MTTRALLSGGIGSGKSAAAAVFGELGGAVISADTAGHRVLEPGGLAEAEVAERWPAAVVDGRIDRRALGRIVFSKPGNLADLESITHPAIRRLILAEVDEAGEVPLVMVEVPLPLDFLGAGWVRVVVDAPEEQRIFRLRLRGMDPEEIAGRMAVQPNRDEWLAMADHVIDNSQDLEHLQDECGRVWRVLVGDPQP